MSRSPKTATAPTPDPRRGESPRVRVNMIDEGSYIHRTDRLVPGNRLEERVADAVARGGTCLSVLAGIVRANGCHPATVLRIARVELDEKSPAYLELMSIYDGKRKAVLR